MKVLVTDKVSEKGVALLQKSFEVDVKHGISQEELIGIIPEYSALVVRSETKVTKAVIEAADRLVVIGRAGVGVDNIDVPAATHKGIIVLNAPDGNTIAATEHTMAMMMALARNIPQAYHSMKEGQWQRSKYVGVEMRGKTLGIVGLGRIGSGVAKRAAAMEMNILAYDPFISEERAKELDLELASLDEIYAQADFITFHLPLTAETKYMVNKEAFAKMKPGVRLINCARGGVIEENALAEAVKEGIVAGAAIDVFEKEPVDADNPLLALENVIFTPHLGASTKEAQIGVAVDVAESVIAALKEEPVTTAVNMPPLPGKVLEFVKPYLNLVEKMGSLVSQLCEGGIHTVEVQYSGDIVEVDTKILTIATLKGILNPILKESVNYVNASLLAKSRGIKVKEVQTKEHENFTSLMSVIVTTDKGKHEIAGTLFGLKEERIVMIDGYRVDIEPQGWLLFVPHLDHPGMVGRVGSILGDNKINMNRMQLERTKNADQIMVVSVDAEIPAATIHKIKEVEGIQGAKLINLMNV